jgi:alkylation response protein AidB-like acyl-CoA dehydrogenase
MNFDLTNEQIQLRDSAMRLGREHHDFRAWRARVSEGGAFDRAAWTRMAELGWLGVNIPEAHGGLDGSPVDTMVLMEAFGRFLILEPFVSTCVIAPSLLAYAKGPLGAGLMARIAEGTVLIALADGEPASRFDSKWVATRAARTEDGYVLAGEKNHVMDGASADWFLVPARTAGGAADEEGVSLFLVPADAPRLAIEPIRGMDNRINAKLRLNGVSVGADAIVGGEGKALPLIQQAIDRAITARLAEAVGAMDAVNEITQQYLKTRRQFGQPIGAFQALQHRAVDMLIACEEARSMCYLATLSLTEARPECSHIVSAAKARVGQTSLFVGRQAVQLHGGVGFSDELVVGHYLKRMIMIDMSFGNADHHRGRFADMNQTRASALGS